MDERKTARRWLLLQEDPLPLVFTEAFLYTPAAGGVDLFIGTTRQWTGDAETVRLTYECYAPMAMDEMARLAAEAEATWPVARLLLWHRLGQVPVAEASVIIGVATPHRTDAFAACRYLIDQLKMRVPIWKREHFADGTTTWVEGSLPPVILTSDEEHDG